MEWWSGDFLVQEFPHSHVVGPAFPSVLGFLHAEALEGRGR